MAMEMAVGEHLVDSVEDRRGEVSRPLVVIWTKCHVERKHVFAISGSQSVPGVWVLVVMLDFILRSKGIKTIALGGFLTNCCVESTMRTGYENGYQVITLTDCVAATSMDEHANAIDKDFPMFSQPMSHEDFLGQLAGDLAAIDASRGYN